MYHCDVVQRSHVIYIITQSTRAGKEKESLLLFKSRTDFHRPYPYSDLEVVSFLFRRVIRFSELLFVVCSVAKTNL